MSLKKILIASESYWPNVDGGAVAQHRLAKGLVKRGLKVYIWAPGKQFKSSLEKDGETIIYRERAIPINSRNYWFSFWPYRHAFSLIREIKPDLIHIETPFQIGLAALIAAKYYHIPVVATNHVMPENILSAKLPAVWRRFLSKIIWSYIIFIHNRVNFVTSPSEIALGYLQKHQLKTSSEVISNGLDLNLYSGHRKVDPANSSEERPVKLLYVGRHDQEKNLAFLIEVFEKIKDQVDLPIQFDLAGSGSELATLKKMVQEKNLTKQVIFHGLVSETEKLALFKEADFFVISSPSELQSLVTMEAMASGLPVVALRAGALPNLVIEDQTGFLVNPGDLTEFSQKCLLLILSPELRLRLGENARQLIQKKHDQEKSFDRYLEIYQKLTN
jgi:glycosyltransferase involved in cell wall biosynthesis